MTTTTYGEHAELAARALNMLVGTNTLPAVPAEVAQLLHCREAVVDALRQRLFDLGHDSWYPSAHHIPAYRELATLTGLDEKLATLVDDIAFALPSMRVSARPVPSEVLGSRSENRVVELWREAAVELLGGSHVLCTALERPWRIDRGAAWWVMRDVSVALEAVLVLDARLEEVGLLGEHLHSHHPMGLDEKRVVLSQAARVATWHATTSIPDEATARTRRAVRSRLLEPVSLVRGPEDLAPAQRRLAQFLRPMTASNVMFVGEPEISADSARQVTSSQLYLCRMFAQAAARSHPAESFASYFDERAEVLEALQPQIAYLLDARASEPNMRRFWQQAELTTAVARMEDKGQPIALQPTQMAALVNATHDVTHNLGTALRREMMRGTTNLLDGHPRHEEGPIRVGRRSRLGATLTDLANLPAPNEPVTRFDNPLQRAALRQVLDLTPSTNQTPPPPFPATRNAISSPRPF